MQIASAVDAKSLVWKNVQMKMSVSWCPSRSIWPPKRSTWPSRDLRWIWSLGFWSHMPERKNGRLGRPPIFWASDFGKNCHLLKVDLVNHFSTQLSYLKTDRLVNSSAIDKSTGRKVLIKVQLILMFFHINLLILSANQHVGWCQKCASQNLKIW